MTILGKGIDRVDARQKVMGKATYAADTAVANVAYAVIVGATIARGKVIGLDDAAARNAPGVLAVLTPANAPALPGAAASAANPQDRKLQFLQDSDVRYDGQPIALVVADTLEHAQHAASLVKAKYAAEKASIALEEELASAYMPKETARGAPDTSHGDFSGAFAAAKVQVDATYTMMPENHNPMELHGSVAVWQGDDSLTIYDATQGGFVARDKIASLFGLKKENVRVISHFLGGGFGSKGSPWSHVPLAVMAAKVVKRPVKLVVTRPQMFSFVGHRPKLIQRIQLGANPDGKLVAMRHDLTAWTSRFDEFVEPAAAWSRAIYACENAATTHRLVRLDVPTPTYMRAPGAASGSYAMEAAMDELAVALNMDPLALRLKNYADKDYDSGKKFSSKELRACYKQGAERFGWAKRALMPRTMRDGSWLIGWGMATASYPAHMRGASARAERKEDGTFLVQAGTHDLGTGAYTIMTQIAADELGVPIEKVRFELGDTQLPETPLAAGSQTTASVGSAVKAACKKLRESSETSVTVTTQEREDRKQLACHSFGAQFVEVKVDAGTGEIRVTRAVGAFAGGKIMNEKTARSQLLGGMVWGIGLALLEGTQRDARDGRVVTRDLADYHVPINADVPEIDVIMVPEEDPHVSDVGAKGLGELGITGMGAAIANAVYHATGKRVRDLPITLDKLL
jgi:xanthine dehydrogenase YagR molybdenum-binding subunit